HDDPVIGVEVQHDQLGSPPRALQVTTGHATRELSRRGAAQHVGLLDDDLGDAAAADLAVEIPSDRLSLRQLWHWIAASGARSRASRCPTRTAFPRSARA